MPQFNQSEINSIREVALSHQSMSRKFADYATQCNDPQISQMFSKAGTECQQAAHNLIQMLQ